VKNLAASVPFVTKDGSTIREVAGPVSLPTANQSLAEATVAPGRPRRFAASQRGHRHAVAGGSGDGGGSSEACESDG